MADNFTEDQIDVPLQSTPTYYLHVQIGQGQAGTTTFEDFNGDYCSPKVFNALIGLGSAVKGKSSDVVSVIMSVNPDSPNLSINYYVTDHKLASPDDLDNSSFVGEAIYKATAGDSVTFTTTLNFK